MSKQVGVLIMMVLGLNACVKVSNITPDQVQQKKLLVMVSGTPHPYVWTTAEGMVVVASAYLIGLYAYPLLAADLLVDAGLGHKFDAALSEYPLDLKLRTAVMAELAKSPGQTLAPVCLPGEDPASRCVEITSLDALKQDYAGQMLLVIKPCEWGLRNGKPYININAALFEIDTQGVVWYSSKCLKGQEIEVKRKSLKKWKSDLKGLTTCLDDQIEVIAPTIAQKVQQGLALRPKAFSEGWVLVGCMPPNFNKCVAPSPQ